MGLFGKKKPQTIHIKGPGKFNCNVKGESNYQRALAKICGERSEEGTNKIVEATLVLEDDNKFDKNAVYVQIQGQKVGYLDKEHAPDYRAQLKRDGLAGVNVTCRAKIVGGWDRGGEDRGHFGVLLDLPREYC